MPLGINHQIMVYCLGQIDVLLTKKMTLGIAAGFSQSDLSNHFDHANSNNYHAAIYGSALWQPIAVRAGLGHFTSHSYRTLNQ